ncbi:uncharacterized protein LOC106169672 [Lingula anatina]|uniref:Uncharacterized protein LOC106169672 n=1 Tax=Lingula anatina TaxID=7574 RepID=A0A1S3J352_LINAN|nr:uncharacterized protein LOC106169672 [Lingula anatina]|eukprot:XP_013404706.1 uncharacterized protein LOC106169672 [Lingula anatina]
MNSSLLNALKKADAQPESGWKHASLFSSTSPSSSSCSEQQLSEDPLSWVTKQTGSSQSSEIISASQSKSESESDEVLLIESSPEAEKARINSSEGTVVQQHRMQEHNSAHIGRVPNTYDQGASGASPLGSPSPQKMIPRSLTLVTHGGSPGTPRSQIVRTVPIQVVTTLGTGAPVRQPAQSLSPGTHGGSGNRPGILRQVIHQGQTTQQNFVNTVQQSLPTGIQAASPEKNIQVLVYSTTNQPPAQKYQKKIGKHGEVQFLRMSAQGPKEGSKPLVKQGLQQKISASAAAKVHLSQNQGRPIFPNCSKNQNAMNSQMLHQDFQPKIVEVSSSHIPLGTPHQASQNISAANNVQTTVIGSSTTSPTKALINNKSPVKLVFLGPESKNPDALAHMVSHISTVAGKPVSVQTNLVGNGGVDSNTMVIEKNALCFIDNKLMQWDGTKLVEVGVLPGQVKGGGGGKNSPGQVWNGRVFKHVNVEDLARKPIHAASTAVTQNSTVNSSSGQSVVTMTPVQPKKPSRKRPVPPDDGGDYYIACSKCGQLSKDYLNCDDCGRPLPETVKWYKASEESKSKNVKLSKPIDQKTFYKSKLSVHSSLYKDMTFEEDNPLGKTTRSPSVQGNRGGKTGQIRGRGRGKGRGRVPLKFLEPETVTISSSEDEESHSTSNSISNSSRSTPESNKELEVAPKKPLTRREKMEGPDGKPAGGGQPEFIEGVHYVRVAQPQAPPPATTNVQEEEDLPIQRLVLEAKRVMLGSLPGIPFEPIILSPEVIRMKIECQDDSVNISLYPNDIVKCKGHFGQKMAVLFLYTTPGCGARVRSLCHMNQATDPCYDPGSIQQNRKCITIIFPHPQPKAQEKKIEKIFEMIQEKQGEEQNSEEKTKLYSHVTDKETLEIMTDINTKQNQQLERSRQDKAADEDQQMGEVEDMEMPHVYRFTGPIVKLLVWPPPPAIGGITVTNEDLFCLNDGEFLNDVIIDFYLKYLYVTMLSEQDRQRTHIFSSFFYRRLVQKNISRYSTSETQNMSTSEKRHNRVKTWTKNVDIFDKDFIIVPINESAHWFLAIICFPGIDRPETYEYTKTFKVEEPFMRLLKDHKTKSILTIDKNKLKEKNKQELSTNVAVKVATQGKVTVVRLKQTDKDDKSKKTLTVTPPEELDDMRLQEKAENDLLAAHTLITLAQGDESIAKETESQSSSNCSSQESKEEPMDCDEADTPSTPNKEEKMEVEGGSKEMVDSQSSVETPETTQKVKEEEKTSAKPNKTLTLQQTVQGIKKQPCILIFDSLPGPSRSGVVRTLREYLQVEWNKKKQTKKVFDKDTIKGANPKAPQQNNYSDCGVYVLQYVESFFQNPIKDFNIPIKELENWFTVELVSKKREELKNLILILQKEQDEKPVKVKEEKEEEKPETSAQSTSET